MIHKSILSALLVFLLVVPTFATTFYVDGSKADDSGDGLSWANAKKTITAGIGLWSSTGDIVEVSGGEGGRTYTEYVDINNINGGASYYTLMGSDDASHNGTVTIAQSGVNAYNVNVHGSSQYIKVKDFTITMDATHTDAAISVYTTGSHIVLDGLTIDGENSHGYADEYSGIAIWGETTYATVQNNTITGICDVGIHLNADSHINRYHIVQDNTVTGFGYCGIRVRRSNYSIIRRNYIYGPLNASEGDTRLIGLRDSHYCLIENNNAFFKNLGSQYQHYIELRGFTGCGGQGDAQSNFNLITNNTFGFDSGKDAKNAIYFADDSEGNIIQNNIFEGSYDSDANAFMSCWDAECSRPDQIVRNNIITGSVDVWNHSGCTGTTYTQENNSVSTATGWGATGDKPSPYYDISASQNGTADGGNGWGVPGTDYDQVARSSPPDIGAFEYGSAPEITMQGGGSITGEYNASGVILQ